jgi:hypothetical protein
MTTAQWRTLTYVLAVVFLVLIGLLLVVILSRTGDDGVGSAATPTPSARASTSAAPGGGAGSPEPTPESSASTSVDGSPSAAPSPSGTGTVPGARAVIRDLGVDDPDSLQARPRVIVFTSEGGGDVTVKLQKATGGKVKVCIYPGTLAKPLGDPACLRNTGGTLTGHAKGKKPFTWTVTLIGTKSGMTAMADLRIDWSAVAPRLEILDVRLQGKGAEPYNGVRVDLAGRPAAGPLTAAARWTGEHPFEATITDRDTGATLRSADGDAAGVELEADLEAKQRPAVSLSNPGATVATEVLAALVLTWP